uniref:BTB domain-containing protein n=1 Tax=Meloidogyne hapla TaxID=6305 RepID=A0A1I8B4L9_MELHA
MFFNSDFPFIQWNICVEVIKHGTHITIWLRQHGGGKKDVNTQYKIWASKENVIFEDKSKLGFTEFPVNDLPLNGHLVLHCKVKADCYCALDKLQNIYRNMFEDKTLSDIVIKVGSEEIKAHRCVLTQNSKVFRTMLEQKEMSEALKGVVMLTDITSESVRPSLDSVHINPDSVKAMLEFFYTGTISEEVLKDHVESIFHIGHMYQNELLQYECERFMSSKIGTENFVKYCSIIDLYGASTLKDACVKFIFATKDFLNSSEWKEVKSKYPQLAIQILEQACVERANKKDFLDGEDWENVKVTYPDLAIKVMESVFLGIDINRCF